MNIADIILLSIALAMDCFTVSIASGIIMRRSINCVVMRMCVLFGVFQALMPLLGWLCVNSFSSRIESVAGWIAFTLLLFIALKMIRESVCKAKENSFNPSMLRTQLILAVATSIDAFAVGISLSCVGYTTIETLSLPLLLIGLTSFLLPIMGYTLGVKFGRVVEQRLKPELLGGIILIFIAIKVLIYNLLGI